MTEIWTAAGFLKEAKRDLFSLIVSPTFGTLTPEASLSQKATTNARGLSKM